MIDCNVLDVQGFYPSIHGMRNPMNSWNKSDSEFDSGNFCDSYFRVGENDKELMRKLFKAGVEHRKYLRMMIVWMDITAPLYWWKEFDTYKVGTVANSCSTMHKIHDKEFELSDFSTEQLDPLSLEWFNGILSILNANRYAYLRSKDKSDWWQMIQLLPSSYNQKRTVMMSYEVAVKMIKERTGHKLDEWNEFIYELKKLPLMYYLLEDDGK